MSSKVFISYSKDDFALVKPVVAIMRSTRGIVFFDVDSILPGDKWRDKLNDAIDDADLVVVFWCDHSNSSEEVMWEYERAIERGKNVLPVLLDSTPLPPKLCEYQWLDFRDIIGKEHGTSARNFRYRIEYPKREGVILFCLTTILTFCMFLVTIEISKGYKNHFLSIGFFILFVIFIVSLVLGELLIKSQPAIAKTLLAEIMRRLNDDDSNDISDYDDGNYDGGGDLDPIES